MFELIHICLPNIKISYVVEKKNRNDEFPANTTNILREVVILKTEEQPRILETLDCPKEESFIPAKIKPSSSWQNKLSVFSKKNYKESKLLFACSLLCIGN